MKQACVCVLGMHRSGTSLVASIFEQLGVDFGRNLLHAMDNVNEKGFWEPRRMVEAHERLLGALDRAWYDTVPLPEHWQESEAALVFKQDMKDWIISEFQASNLFCLKDPRMCLFLPIWQTIFREIGIDVHYVVVERHPLEIGLSLMKRDNIPPLYSMALTQYYLALAWACMDKQTVFVLRYQDVIQNWRESFSDVMEHLDLNGEVLGEDAGGLLDSSLRHHHISEEILNQLSEAVKADDWTSPAQPMLMNTPELAGYLSKVRSVWKEKHSEYVHAQAVVAERDMQLANVNQQLANVNQQLANVNQQLAAIYKSWWGWWVVRWMRK